MNSKEIKLNTNLKESKLKNQRIDRILNFLAKEKNKVWREIGLEKGRRN
jgi:hypothetical protein